MNNIKCINQNALLHNLKFCQSFDKKIMAMVKADAYGHGMKNIVNILNNKVAFWGVANADEALKLRRILPKGCVLVVGKTKQFKPLIKNNIDITIDTLQELKEIENICKQHNINANIHIAINTGMNRIGVKNICIFKQILNCIYTSQHIKLKGIFTHCFDEDCIKSHFKQQMIKFKQFVNCVKDKDILVHIGGSFCLTKQIPEFVNMVRVGYFLYGYGAPKLKPVMQIYSKVIKITHCNKGEFVGYGKTLLKRYTGIALLSIGYADGVPLALSNKGYVTINNQRCKIIGKICMDVMMVDVSAKNVKLYDNATIFDNAKFFANITKTSPYEILTNFYKLRGVAKII